MGLCYNFYVQQMAAGRWIVPAGFCTENYWGARIGQITWMSYYSLTAELFWGAQRLFDVRQNLPPDYANTTLFQQVYGSSLSYPGYSGWLPVEELMIDDWEQTMVLVQKNVSARFALLFSDGQQCFPEEALLSARREEEESGPARPSYHYQDMPVRAFQALDWTQGKLRYELSTKHPGCRVPVTWKESLRHFMGDCYAERFLSLRNYAPDHDLRLVCILS